MAFEWINKKWSPNAKDHSNDRKDIICDTEDDVSTLPESAPGSTALVVATGEVYIVNASGKWVKFGAGAN
jgi:hypothetical protein